jgi:hypothetical protein
MLQLRVELATRLIHCHHKEIMVVLVVLHQMSPVVEAAVVVEQALHQQVEMVVEAEMELHHQ